MAKRFFPLLISLVSATALAAAPGPTPGADDGRFIPGADLDGTWEGILSNGGMGIPMIFMIKTVSGQGTTAALDVMETAPKDIPVSFIREKMSIVMEVPAIGGTFDGLVAADLATISGRWTQAGAGGPPVPLILHRKSP